MKKKSRKNKKYSPILKKGVFSFYKNDMLIIAYPRSSLGKDINIARDLVEESSKMDIANIKIIIDGYAFTEYHPVHIHANKVWSDVVREKAIKKEHEIYDEVIEDGYQIIGTLQKENFKGPLPYGHPLETYSGEISQRVERHFNKNIKEIKEFKDAEALVKQMHKDKKLDIKLGYNPGYRYD